LALVALFPVVFIGIVFFFVWAAIALTSEPGAEVLPFVLEITAAVAVPTAVAVLVWLLISWAFGDSMMLSSVGAREVYPDQPENKQLYRSVENVAIAAGIPAPKVYIIEDDGLNAFATGRSPQDASIALTRGIINKLEKLELEAVIAHEMAHIGNRDIRLDMILITGVGVTVFVADIVMRVIFHSNHGGNSKDRGQLVAILFAVWLAFMVFNWIVAPLLRMAVSRRREFAADATGALITRNPRALASALRKISGNSCVRALDSRKSMASVFIADPLKKEFIGGLYATHPPVKERVKRLENM